MTPGMRTVVFAVFCIGVVLASGSNSALGAGASTSNGATVSTANGAAVSNANLAVPSHPPKNGYGGDLAGDPSQAEAAVDQEFNPDKKLAENQKTGKAMSVAGLLPGDEDALIASCLETHPVPPTLMGSLSTLSGQKRESWDFKTYSRFDWCNNTPPDIEGRQALARFCNCVGGTTAVNPNAAMSPEEKAAALAARAKREAMRIREKAKKLVEAVGPGILKARNAMREIIYSKEHATVAADLDQLNQEIKDDVSSEKVAEAKTDKMVYMQYSELSQEVAAEARHWDIIAASAKGDTRASLMALKKLLADFVHANQKLNVLKGQLIRVYDILGVKHDLDDLSWGKHEKNIKPKKEKDPIYYAVGKLKCKCRDVNPKDKAHKVCLCRKKSEEAKADAKKAGKDAPKGDGDAKAALAKAGEKLKSIKQSVIRLSENNNSTVAAAEDVDGPMPRFTRLAANDTDIDRIVAEHVRPKGKDALVGSLAKKAAGGSAYDDGKGHVVDSYPHPSQEGPILTEELLQLQAEVGQEVPNCDEADDDVVMEMEMFY